MPKAQRDLIAAEYASGQQNLDSLAQTHKVSRLSVYTLLKRKGVLVRSRTHITDEHRAAVTSDYGRQRTAEQVAAEQQIGKTTVFRILKRAGVPRLRTSARGRNRELDGTGNRWCTRCGHEGPASEFTTNRYRWKGTENVCRQCVRGKSRETMARARKQKRLFIDRLKTARENRCVDCGKAWPAYVLDFDHVRGKKRFNISQGLQGIWTAQDILQESKKCDLRCSNCHRIRTHGRRG